LWERLSSRDQSSDLPPAEPVGIVMEIPDQS
jgi:hypothetical protein